jgi:transcriptional regulator with XRE-family HTH domain
MVEIDPKAMGAELRRLRGSRSQQEVAEKVGISRTTLAKYELGTRTPRLAVLSSLCAYYRRSVEQILIPRK